MRSLPLLSFCLLFVALGCDAQQATASKDAPAAKPTATHEHAEEALERPPAHEHAEAAVPALDLSGNPVQNEMRLLTDAMNKSLLIIANGDLKDLPPTIFAVHGARNETEKAIKEGRYKPPKNSDDLEGFTATDTAFHDQLVRMVKAAKAGDRKEATAAYADVVIGCTNCHQQYRDGF